MSHLRITLVVDAAQLLAPRCRTGAAPAPYGLGQPPWPAPNQLTWHCGAGDAEAIFRRAEATAKGLGQISTAIRAEGGTAAASMRIAEQVKH